MPFVARLASVVGQRAIINCYPFLAHKLMYCVYLIRSIKDSTKTYIGFTNDIDQHMRKHNERASIFTSDHRTWKLVTYIVFD